MSNIFFLLILNFQYLADCAQNILNCQPYGQQYMNGFPSIYAGYMYGALECSYEGTYICSALHSFERTGPTKNPPQLLLRQ
jgi:hypothetical protein